MAKIRELDQQPHFHAVIAVVLIPLAVQESRAVWQGGKALLQGPSNSKLHLFTLLYHLGLFALFHNLLVGSVRKFLFYRRARSLGCGTVPVYPHKDPVLGLDLLLQARPRLKSHTVIQWISERLAKYGTHYHVTLGGEWVLLTDEPENIKAILGTKFDRFPIGGPRLLASLPILGPNSVFSTNGERWQHNRAVLRPAFVRDQVADLACFDKHTSNMIRKIPRDGSTIDMQKLLQDMTMDSSTDFLLGYSTNMLTDHPAPGADVFIKAFSLASDESAKMGRMMPILLRLPHPTLDSHVKIVREFIRSYLKRAEADREERAARGEPRKRSYVFLDELLDQGHTEEYLTDQLLSVMIAGRDTTAMAITSTLWFLARSPQAVEKLRDEVAGVGAQDPTWEQLKNMKYLNNVIKESLRLIPPVPTNARTAIEDTVLPRGGGPDGKQCILVPRGQSVRWSSMSMQRRTDIYGPDADKFRPERWEEDVLRPVWEYVPFSGGPRICIGQQFALTQMSFVLFRLFQAFKAIEPRDDDELRLQPGLTVSFALGCPVVMVPA